MNRNDKKNKTLKNILKVIAIVSFWMMLWQILYKLTNQNLIIPSPLATILNFLNLCHQKYFWECIFYTNIRVVCGFLLGIMSGIILAIACKFSFTAKTLITPAINTIKSTPVASFIVIALLWFNTSNVPIFTSFLIVLPAIFENTIQGICSIDPKLIDLAKIYRIKTKDKLTKIFIPDILPYFVAACNSSLGFAWKAAVAAEVIAGTKFSIGKQIYNSKLYLETENLFAWTVSTVLFSIILEKIVVHFLNKLKNT